MSDPNEPIDPFAGLDDEQAMSSSDARTALLEKARRGYCPMRNVFVQHPNTEKVRPSTLGALVNGRQELALDALLLLHALQPILDDDPLPMGAWANLLSSGRRTCSVPTASKTFGSLEEMQLITRQRVGRSIVLAPKLEDGSGNAWVKAGSAEIPEGYFTIPHEYWTDGYADRLHLPGKAMLLITLKETQGVKHRSFEMALERAQAWYGVSERTAERGFAELDKEKILLTHIQKVTNPKLPAGVLQRKYHRALRDPFSTECRERLQKLSRKPHTEAAKGEPKQTKGGERDGRRSQSKRRRPPRNVDAGRSLRPDREGRS